MYQGRDKSDKTESQSKPHDVEVMELFLLIVFFSYRCEKEGC